MEITSASSEDTKSLFQADSDSVRYQCGTTENVNCSNGAEYEGRLVYSVGFDDNIVWTAAPTEDTATTLSDAIGAYFASLNSSNPVDTTMKVTLSGYRLSFVNNQVLCTAGDGSTTPGEGFPEACVQDGGG